VLATLVRAGEMLIPRGDTIIQAGDKIIALVKIEQQSELVRIFG
jgi:Trk K+ transport system NAD-binding subunit